MNLARPGCQVAQPAASLTGLITASQQLLTVCLVSSNQKVTAGRPKVRISTESCQRL